MPDLKIAVSETGPVPDNQCALKDAILVAASAGITDGAQIVEMARAFFAFLQAPNGDGSVAPAPAQPVQTQAPGDNPSQQAADQQAAAAQPQPPQ